MKAVVTDSYGSPAVLKLEDVPTPVPKAKEVLIKVHAASLNAADWHVLRADPFLVRLMFGFFKPKFRILGADMAGTVQAVGPGVTQFKPGDKVYGDQAFHTMGAFAEYACGHEDLFAHKPTNLSFEQAAAVPLAGVTALQGLRNLGRIETGKKVLINGSSGGVGTFAVQIAKAYGAEVTAVCSTRNVDQARTLGADYVIDYTQQNFTQNGKQYDLILAANGYHPISKYKQSLSAGGIYVMIGGAYAQMWEAISRGPWLSMFGDRKITRLDAKGNGDDLRTLKDLIEAGKVTPVIEKMFSLEQVADGLRYLEEGHAQGKIVIQVAKENA